MKELVIDLSYHNGSVDFQKMKNAGVYGVIIRAGLVYTIAVKATDLKKN